MKAYIHQCLATSLAALAWTSPPLCADSDGSSTLSGNLDGLRRHWAEQGANFEAVYTADVIANRRGGLGRCSKILDNNDVQLADALTREKYWRMTALSGSAADNAESAVEISYRASVLDGLVVQPDLQYIIDPGPGQRPGTWGALRDFSVMNCSRTINTRSQGG